MAATKAALQMDLEDLEVVLQLVEQELELEVVDHLIVVVDLAVQADLAVMLELELVLEVLDLDLA